MLRHPLEIVRAVFELLRLAWITRFGFGRAYWQWRLHTAFGRGWPESGRERLEAVLGYARWIVRMRRFE